jgi:A/G-specific adenine glycosylase
MNLPLMLLSWYEKNKREFPFRGTDDPYRIWISEVIMQQTRIGQGLAYYSKFLGRFPDIFSLADATEEDVLNIWQGLGYYSRARHLYATAKEICGSHGGEFPGTYAELRKLKGIGDYSAASIASLSFNEPAPAIDGNVFRFLSRYFGITGPAGSSAGRKKAREYAWQFIDRSQPGVSNQALIEHGALVCKPAQPACTTCQFNVTCFALNNDLVQSLPDRIKPAKLRSRYFHYFVFLFTTDNRQRILLKKRTGNDIWKNLYDFPVVETSRKISVIRLTETVEWKNLMGQGRPENMHISPAYRHVLSHQVIYARFLLIRSAPPPGFTGTGISLDSVPGYPLPKLLVRYFNDFFPGIIG